MKSLPLLVPFVSRVSMNVPHNYSDQEQALEQTLKMHNLELSEPTSPPKSASHQKKRARRTSGSD